MTTGEPAESRFKLTETSLRHIDGLDLSTGTSMGATGNEGFTRQRLDLIMVGFNQA